MWLWICCIARSCFPKLLFLCALHARYTDLLDQICSCFKVLENASLNSMVKDICYHDSFTLAGPIKSPCPPLGSRVPKASAANVCVCELNLQLGWAALITRCQPQGWLTHPPCLQGHTPLDSADQFPPGENVNWWVSLGNVDKTGTENSYRHSMVTFWYPARCVTLWHLGTGSHNLPFLPPQISDEYVPCVVSVTSCSMTPILIQAKGGKA